MSDKYIIKYLNKEEYNLWDFFVDECENGTIFNKSFWLENIYKYQKNVDLHIIGCFNNGELIGGCAIGFKKKFFVFSLMVPPVYTPYYGILIKERETKYISKKESHQISVYNKLNSFLKERYCQVISAFSPHNIDIRYFSWNGFSEKIKYTYISELDKIENIYENFDPSLKRQIKKGLKQDYRIRYDFSSQELKTSYDLIKGMSIRKNRSSFLSFKDFSDFLLNLNEKGNVIISNVYKNDISVYSVIIVIDKKTAYYWLAGGDYKHYNTGLNQVLLYDIFKKLYKENCQTFDFIGANTQSISQYKSNFGFELVPYYNVDKVNSRLLKILFNIKSIIKKS